MSLKDDKPILRFNEQLEKLNDLGIYVADNEIHEAKNILSNHNYFFKLLAYRKNYDKNEQK
ncbi:TPA: Abi family protein, partial [Enterococcus faecium]